VKIVGKVAMWTYLNAIAAFLVFLGSIQFAQAIPCDEAQVVNCTGTACVIVTGNVFACCNIVGSQCCQRGCATVDCNVDPGVPGGTCTGSGVAAAVGSLMSLPCQNGKCAQSL
jgi:hypothetical protein